MEADPSLPGSEVERRYVEAVAGIKAAVKIPVAVKLSPYFTSLANVVAQLEQTGVAGVVLFNRFLQPDISLERMAPSSVMSLSSPSEALLPLRWIGLLYGRVRLDLAASTGIHDSAGALKQLLAGATVVQLASTPARNGVPHLGKVLNGIEEWMERRGHSTLDEFRGTLSQSKSATRGPSSGPSTSTSSCRRTPRLRGRQAPNGTCADATETGYHRDIRTHPPREGKRMASLKGSKTHQNLKDAFAGESQANRRYLYFAKVADVEGYPEVASNFRETAEGETGHAHGHLDFLKVVGIRPPACRSGTRPPT